MKVIMLALKIFAAALTAIVLVVGGYVLYVVLQYSRIEDYISLEVQGEATADVSDKDSFKILTYNIGFGAYSTDFSFFMDSGAMKDGSKVYGTGSKGRRQDCRGKKYGGSVGCGRSCRRGFCFSAGNRCKIHPCARRQSACWRRQILFLPTHTFMRKISIRHICSIRFPILTERQTRASSLCRDTG